MLTTLPCAAAPVRRAPVPHRLLARALRHAGRALVAAARRLEQPVRAPHPGLLEFHAEAGAPEGALYVDGRFVARLPGVTRL